MKFLISFRHHSFLEASGLHLKSEMDFIILDMIKHLDTYNTVSVSGGSFFTKAIQHSHSFTVILYKCRNKETSSESKAVQFQ